LLRRGTTTRTRALSAIAFFALASALFAGAAPAQPPNPASPRTSAATQIGEHWIRVDYSAPVLRGRQGIFGSGESYGATVRAGAPVWRAGADSNTRIKTDVALVINGTTVPSGEYSFLIELAEGAWTAILSSQPHIGRVNSREEVQAGMAEGKSWGGYGYKADHDVVRAPMMVQKIENSIDNLSYWFSDVSETGGGLAIGWDDHIAILPFQLAK
jgi:hypothetical protein